MYTRAGPHGMLCGLVVLAGAGVCCPGSVPTAVNSEGTGWAALCNRLSHAVQVMQQIVAAAAKGAPQLAGAQGFMMSQFGGIVCIKGLLEGPLSGQDAATNSLLTELSQLLVKLYALCGEDLLQHVCSDNMPADAQQQDFAAAIRGSDSKQVKLCLRGMMQQRQKEQQATAKSKR